MSKTQHVALVLQADVGYHLRIISGVARYARQHTSWVLIPFHDSYFRVLRDLKAQDVDGIITHIHSPVLARRVRSLRLPAVNVSGFPHDMPQVLSDHGAVGRLAAEHLLERGLRDFAFCGLRKAPWSAGRCKGFRDRLRQAGFDCAIHEASHRAFFPSARNWDAAAESLGQWLAGLPRPVGILAASDPLGRQITESCRSRGIHVPRDAAVIGVDNNELFCQLSNPPLSSVDENCERIGYEGAALLDRLMNSRRVRRQLVVVPPRGVVARHSTEIVATDDAVVAHAAEFIRQNACRGITMKDLLDEVLVSRRCLELRFKRFLGWSPTAEIRRVQLQKAKELLADTDLSMPQIARATGLSSAERLSVIFRRELRTTPTQYRKAARRGSGPDE